MEPQRPELPRPVRIVFGLALMVYIAIALWLVWRTAILEPYSDMFDWVARWYQLQASGDLGHYLWSPHNFHHLVWTFGVLNLDILGFGAQGYLFLVVGVICLAGTAAMLARVAATAAGPGLRLVGAGGSAVLSFKGCDILDVSADINTTYVHALFFAVAALLLAEAPGGRTVLRRSGALACAVAAALGSAAGLAVWPALLFGAWRAGRRGWMFIVLTSAVGFSLLYLLGDTLPDGGAASAGGSGRLHDAVLLFVNYVGLPWVRAVPAASGWFIGAAVLVPAIAAIATKGGRQAPWPERAAVSLILFSLGTAVMAGIARTGQIAPDFVPMRYAVFLIPMHVGLWILALPYLRRAGMRWPRAMAGAVGAAAAVMLVHQGAMGVYAVRTADINLRIIADFRAGNRSAPMLTTIYSNLDRAQALSIRLRRDGFFQRELRPDPLPRP